MMIDEQQVQYDIYYQGSPAQLYALLYPLGGPNSPIFEHLSQQKVTFEPHSKLLTYTYEPQSFQNIDKQKQLLAYTSKPVHNLSNYFYSTFNPQTQCFVWRNLNRFLQMRPQNRLHQDGKNYDKNKKTTTQSKYNKKENSAEVILQQPLIAELQVIESGQLGNLVQKQISQAPITDVKPIWHCSKDEYFSYLAN